MTRHALILILLFVTADAHDANADDRLVRIMVRWASRDFSGLRVQIEETLTAYREARDPRREAIAYLFLSLDDVARGDVQNTLVHLGEATTRFEAAGDSVGAWLAYWMLAEHERLQESQSDQTLAFYEKCLALLEKAKSPSTLFSLDALMVIGPVMGLPPAEYEPNAANPEIVLRLLEAFTRTGHGAEFLRIGELEKAGEQLRRAKEAAAIFGGRIDPPIDRHIGNLRRREWRLDEARESYMRALEGLKVLRPVGTFTPKRLRVEVFADLAELEMRNGSIDDALAWNDRALELVRAENSPETEVLVLRRRAETLVRGGRFAAAEKAFAQALTLADEHQHFHLQIPIYLSSARMNSTRGRYGPAAADLEKALALAKGNEPLWERTILGSLAMMYVLLEADDSARLVFEKARQLAEKNGRCLDVAVIDLLESAGWSVNDETTLADFEKAIEQWLRTPDALSVPGSEHLAQIMASIGTSAPADPQRTVRSGTVSAGTIELLQAGVLFSQGREFATARALAMKSLKLNPNPKHHAGILALTGASYAAETDDDRAITYLTKAIDTLDTAIEDTPVDPLLRNSVGDGWASSSFALLLQLLVKHHRYEEAFSVSERARARVFLQLLSNNRVSPRGPENTLPAQEAETLRMQMLQWQEQIRLAPTGQLTDDLRQARRRYDALMTRVKAANPEYASMTSVEPLHLDAVRRELPPNTTLVSYFVTGNAAHAWALDRRTLQYVSLPFGPMARERAQCAARRLRGGGRGIRVIDTACAPATAEELYGRLFAPLRDHIRNSRLVIVPHGVLHHLPFAAFRDPRTQRYLLEDYTITYAPSASAIRFLRDKETPVNGKALIIGAPAGVWPELPGARREAMMASTALQSIPMVGAAAKESLLYQLKGDVDLVHIAAHGFYEPDTPLFSRLALAEGDGSDGNLEVHEILSDVDLTGVNLVVLSACQTAVGKGNAGDEIVGLTRALLYAGTPGVISTLWDIGDEPTAALMNHFYCRLLGGDSASDALRYAQLQLLRGDHPDPRQWAAFTLNGDPEGRWNTSGAIAAGH